MTRKELDAIRAKYAFRCVLDSEPAQLLAHIAEQEAIIEQLREALESESGARRVERETLEAATSHQREVIAQLREALELVNKIIDSKEDGLDATWILGANTVATIKAAIDAAGRGK